MKFFMIFPSISAMLVLIFAVVPSSSSDTIFGSTCPNSPSSEADSGSTFRVCSGMSMSASGAGSTVLADGDGDYARCGLSFTARQHADGRVHSMNEVHDLVRPQSPNLNEGCAFQVQGEPTDFSFTCALNQACGCVACLLSTLPARDLSPADNIENLRGRYIIYVDESNGQEHRVLIDSTSNLVDLTVSGAKPDGVTNFSAHAPSTSVARPTQHDMSTFSECRMSPNGRSFGNEAKGVAMKPGHLGDIAPHALHSAIESCVSETPTVITIASAGLSVSATRPLASGYIHLD